MSAGAAAAAAEAARRRREEEEVMTRYSDADLTEGWEFKILRSATNAFRDPDRLRQVLEEEFRAGRARMSEDVEALILKLVNDSDEKVRRAVQEYSAGTIQRAANENR